MNIVIVDDLESERQELINYVATYCKANQIHTTIESYSSGSKFLREFEADKYSLIFLDIYMGDMDGIKIAEKVREIDPKAAIIFSTTSRSHAIDGFRVRAFDYLVKPYTYETFQSNVYLTSLKIK